MKIPLTLLALCISLPSIDSHGTMVAPPPRQPESIYWYQVGCMIGCTCSGGGKESYPTLETVDCPNPAEPTLDTNDVKALTWNIGNTSPSSRGDWNAYMPWRAPGTSKPLDSCGIASGFAVDAAVQFPHAFVTPNIQQGMKGTELNKGMETQWVAGSVVEAAFRLVVNHGGGYQYRVCRKEEAGENSSGMTEDCFEQNPLAFADGFHTVRFNVDATAPLEEQAASRASVTLNAVDVTEGVQPAGHAWRKLPIPACACDLGDGCYENSSSDGTKAYETPVAAAYGHCDTGLQFEAEHLGKDGVWPEGYGYYVETLGGEGGRSKDAKDACNGMTSEETCVKFSGCLWYASADKTVCYEGTKDASEIECESHDQTACATHDDVCEWADAKSLCYSKARDTKEINTASTTVCNSYDGTACATHSDVCKWDDTKSLCNSKTQDTKDANTKASATVCNSYDGIACATNSDVCKWDDTKSLCYSKTPDAKDANTASAIVCNSHDGIACATHSDVCKWDDTKSLCYSKTQDTKVASTKASTTVCNLYDGIACATHSDVCKWDDTKSLCYSKTQDTKDANTKASTTVCNSHDGTACATHSDVCKWDGSKSLCYSRTHDTNDTSQTKSYSKTQDTKDVNTEAKPQGFDGAGTTVDHETEQYDWILVDKLIAPSEVGRYVLQWRWDNEQTPQIWTTCSDIVVVEKNDDPETDSSAQGIRWMATAGIVGLVVPFWL